MQSSFAPIMPPWVLSELFGTDEYKATLPEFIGPYTLLLAHEVLADPKLFSHFKDMDTFVILDNSVIELGKAMPTDDLAEAAKIVGADVIILPDVLEDTATTIALSFDTLNKLLSWVDSSQRFMVVPQGPSYDTILNCAWGFMSELEDVWIGIPRWITNKFGSRVPILQALLQGNRKLFGRIHMLGCSNNFADDIVCARQIGVVGIDSSIPALYALTGKEFRLETQTSRPDLEFRNKVWSTPREDWATLDSILFNIDMMRRWLK